MRGFVCLFIMIPVGHCHYLWGEDSYSGPPNTHPPPPPAARLILNVPEVVLHVVYHNANIQPWGREGLRGGSQYSGKGIQNPRP